MNSYPFKNSTRWQPQDLQLCAQACVSRVKSRHQLDFLVAYVHGFDPMYVTQPRPSTVKTLRTLVRRGYDAVIASHTHALQAGLALNDSLVLVVSACQ